MQIYRELIPPSRLAERVECLWITENSGPGALKRVTPDGCADIIYTRRNSGTTLSFVGPMTQFGDFAQDAGGCSVGVRFRPGMWSDILRVNGAELTDRVVHLADLWGKRGRGLMNMLDGLERPMEFAKAMAGAVPALEAPRSAFQRAIYALEMSRGRFPLNSAAEAAGFSTRQFRRRCLEATGLSPKLLARILRFRHAAELAASLSGQHAGVAYECGYADQSHLIAEFREFAGRTPREMAASFTTSPAPRPRHP